MNTSSTEQEVNRRNFPALLEAFMNEESLNAKNIADLLGCSDSTITRILKGVTQASDHMLKHGGILMELGPARFAALSEAEREKISEIIGAASGGAIGFASITAAVGSMGSVAGLSAAGISSGLAAIGGLVGGGMAAGIAMTAAIPIALAGAGYFLVKGLRSFFSSSSTDARSIDDRWELRISLPCTGPEQGAAPKS